MPSHADIDAFRPENPQNLEFMRRLNERANIARDRLLSEITAGTPSEAPLARWEYEGMTIEHRPDDEQKILRISIGGGDHLPIKGDYCTFRGARIECVKLLRKALEALSEGAP